MPTEHQSHLNFMRDRFGGSNWVLAQRRTPALVHRYGADVIIVTRKRYREVEREYRTLYGDPYDAVRAELYLAAKYALDSIGAGALHDRLAAALKAEAEA